MPLFSREADAFVAGACCAGRAVGLKADEIALLGIAGENQACVFQNKDRVKLLSLADTHLAGISQGANISVITGHVVRQNS